MLLVDSESEPPCPRTMNRKQSKKQSSKECECMGDWVSKLHQKQGLPLLQRWTMMRVEFLEGLFDHTAIDSGLVL
jgi:hypothetical protein